MMSGVAVLSDTFHMPVCFSLVPCEAVWWLSRAYMLGISEQSLQQDASERGPRLCRINS